MLRHSQIKKPANFLAVMYTLSSLQVPTLQVIFQKYFSTPICVAEVSFSL